MNPMKKTRSSVMIVVLVGLVVGACSFFARVPPSTPTIPAPGASLPSPAASLPSPESSTRFVIYFIALEDNGKSGKPVGCNDSLVPVEWEIPVSDSPPQAAIEKLLSFKGEQYIGASGLYNALYQADLVVDRIDIDSAGKAAVQLSGEFLLGGVCDNPRFKGQLEETMLQFPEVNSVELFINGRPLDEILSGK